MKPSWGCCTLEDDDSDYVTCVNCNKSFHLACIASTSSTPSSGWMCPLCRGRAREKNNDNTPLRTNENSIARSHKRVALQSPKFDAEAALTREDVRDVVQDVFDKQMENMFVRFSEQIRTTVASALAPITKDIQDLQQSVAHVNEQYEDIIKGHSQMSDTVKKLQAENSTLRSENKNFSFRLHQLEQNTREQNACVIEGQNENSMQTGLQIGKTIDDAVYELQERSRREKNIIITGIPEIPNKNTGERRESDSNEATKIIQSLYKDCQVPINTIRLGKYVANKNRNLKVILDSSKTAKNILKNRNSIIGDHKIFSDQTPTQRKVIGELRAELSQRQQNGETSLVIKYIKGAPKIVNDASKNYNLPSAVA